MRARHAWLFNANSPAKQSTDGGALLHSGGIKKVRCRRTLSNKALKSPGQTIITMIKPKPTGSGGEVSWQAFQFCLSLLLPRCEAWAKSMLLC